MWKYIKFSTIVHFRCSLDHSQIMLEMIIRFCKDAFSLVVSDFWMLCVCIYFLDCSCTYRLNKLNRLNRGDPKFIWGGTSSVMTNLLLSFLATPQTASIQVAKSKIAAGQFEVESLLARRRVETHPAIRVFVFEKRHGWRWGKCQRAWAGAAWSFWFLKGFSASINLGPSQASVIRMAQQADNHEKQKKLTFMMRDWAKFTARKKAESEERKHVPYYNKVINFDVQLWTICEDELYLKSWDLLCRGVLLLFYTICSC